MHTPESPTPPKRDSPYKGLTAYTETDANYFFGRERFTRVVVMNLVASRLTLLYGPSGVGKSSVLRAGVVHHLKEQTQHSLSRSARQRADHVAVMFSDWRDPKPLKRLYEAIRTQVNEVLPGRIESQPSDFVSTLARWTSELDADLLLIFDQFEEFFLYQLHIDDEGRFASEFADAVNQPGLRVNFMLSFREDALAKLDFFKTSIPSLFSNFLRVPYLDFAAARDAIIRPLIVFNERPSARLPVTIEPELVDAILDQVSVGNIVIGETGRGTLSQDPPDLGIETPYLQLVMTTLWDVERTANSRILRRRTFFGLGGAEKIIRDHLLIAIDVLPLAQKDILARVFDRLVTPSRTKIALSLDDLTENAEVSPDQLKVVLEHLANEKYRILRPVPPDPRKRDDPRFEIFHDILATPIIEWRTKFVAAQKELRVKEQERKAREDAKRRQNARFMLIGLIGAVITILIIGILLLFALQQQGLALNSAATAVAAEATSRAARSTAEADNWKAQTQAANAQAIADGFLTNVPVQTGAANGTIEAFRQTAEAAGTAAAQILLTPTPTPAPPATATQAVTASPTATRFPSTAPTQMMTLTGTPSPSQTAPVAETQVPTSPPREREPQPQSTAPPQAPAEPTAPSPATAKPTAPSPATAKPTAPSPATAEPTAPRIPTPPP